MLNINIYNELLSVFANMNPLNISEKIEEFLKHPAFIEDKIHLQLIQDYLDDEEIYNQRVERYHTIIQTLDNGNEYLELEPIFIFISLDLFIYYSILNSKEKKVLLIKILDVLDRENNDKVDFDKYIEVQEFLLSYRLFIHNQLLDSDTDHLKNLETVNELVNGLTNHEYSFGNLDESYLKLVRTNKNFYSEKREYLKDKRSIEKEKLLKEDNTVVNPKDEKFNELEKLWLATAKISINELMEIGINNHIWDDNNNIISQRGSLYGSGKSLLSSMAIALRNYALPETVDYKAVGNAFCKAFNVPINENTREPYKAFSSGNPKIIKQFKRLYKI